MIMRSISVKRGTDRQTDQNRHGEEILLGAESGIYEVLIPFHGRERESASTATAVRNANGFQIHAGSSDFDADRRGTKEWESIARFCLVVVLLNIT